MFWKDWAGYHAVRSYDTTHDREYFALRHSAGLIDVSPLQKYEVRGKDAARFLAFVMVRDIRRLREGRMTYLCWCDDAGKVLDDGTVGRLGREHYRVTSNHPALTWLTRHADGYDVTIEDSTDRFGTLALQGPKSRDVACALAGPAVAGLKFFRIMPAEIAGTPGWISRTGYTGDLGYELWVERDAALAAYDAVIEAGRPYRLEPTGLDAMDVTRVEAGFVLNGVDYFSANRCMIEARKSTPDEINLGWSVELDREPFVGSRAIAEERERGQVWHLVGLEYDWDEYEALFAEFGLPPHVRPGAWRDAVPVYDAEGRQVGQATSGAWSPILKKNLALASVRPGWHEPGMRLSVEVTVEYERRRVRATVARTPFFDPPRKRA